MATFKKKGVLLYWV